MNKIIKEALYAAVVLLAVGVIVIPIWWGKQSASVEWEGDAIWMATAEQKEWEIAPRIEEEDKDCPEENRTLEPEGGTLRMKEPPPTIETPMEPPKPGSTVEPESIQEEER